MLEFVLGYTAGQHTATRAANLARDAAVSDGTLHTNRIEDLRERVDAMAMIMRAMWSLMEEQGMTSEQLIAKLDELDRLDGGPGTLAGLPGVVSASAAADAVGDASDRQAIVMNLVLEDDNALGGVVGALAGTGSHILGLRKSEPTLEDVFVELVGRGFDESGTDEPGPSAEAIA